MDIVRRHAGGARREISSELIELALLGIEVVFVLFELALGVAQLFLSIEGRSLPLWPLQRLDAVPQSWLRPYLLGFCVVRFGLHPRC